MNNISKRKAAYKYIVRGAKKLNWDPPIDSDERLAAVLNVSLSEVISLKKGFSNPSDKLVAKFKELMRPALREDEIDYYLVSPFKKPSK
jgi:hypothetical protein